MRRRHLLGPRTIDRRQAGTHIAAPSAACPAGPPLPRLDMTTLACRHVSTATAGIVLYWTDSDTSCQNTLSIDQILDYHLLLHATDVNSCNL
jgi:hypothetical protein